MKIAFWNCRGMRKKIFWTNLNIICKNEAIQVIILAETKTSVEPDESLWKNAGFDNILFVPAVGFAGGLCMLWKEYQFRDEKIEIIRTHSRYITLNHINITSGFETRVFGIYAPPNEQKKDEFLSHFVSDFKSSNMPTLAIGDYYELQEPLDK